MVARAHHIYGHISFWNDQAFDTGPFRVVSAQQLDNDLSS